jgi:hypothetical protein
LTIRESACAKGESLLPALYYDESATAIRRGLSRQSGRNGKRGVHKLRNAPSPIDNANGLRWRRAQGFMNPAEIVVSDVQRDRRDVVIQLL